MRMKLLKRYVALSIFLASMLGLATLIQAANVDVRPDATASVTASSCTTGTAHTSLDEDVDGAADGVQCTATANSSNHDIRLQFATPASAPSNATNAQVFAFRAKRNATGGNGNPTAAADYYCNGSLVAAGSAQVLTDTYDIYTQTFTFNTGSCASDGSDVEVLLNCTTNGGGANQRSCSYESVEWREETQTAPTVTSNAATSITATAATANGNITATGGANATARGFATSTVSNLTSSVSTTTFTGSFGTGAFSATYSNTNLTGNTTYYFRAYATNPVGTSYGNILNFLTLPDTPGTPTFGTVTATTTVVSWTAPTGGTATYKLQYCVNGSTPCTLSTGLAVTSTTTNPLVGNTTYSYAVRGTNTTGDGVFSASSTQLTLPDVPGTPTFSNITASAMRVSWAAPTGGASTYKVERCTGSGCSNFVEIASGVATAFYDDSGLDAVTTYRYRIRGTNATGDGLYSTPAEQATGANAPSVTTNAATGVSDTIATLNGNISDTGGANATDRGFAWGTDPLLSGGDTATTTESGSFGTGTFSTGLSSLTQSTTYYFRAYATNSGGTGFGSITSFTTTTSSFPPRRIRLFEGVKVKIINSRIFVNQE